MRAITVFFLLLSMVTHGQGDYERSSKLYGGLTFGGYWANKYTAIRYDGLDVEYSYDFGVNRVIMSNQQIYNRIYNEYDQRDFTWCEYPGQDPADPIRYRTAMVVGGQAGYYLNDMTALIVDAEFIRLKVADAIAFCIDDPFVSDPIIMQETIEGSERRFQAQIGLHFEFTDEPSSAYLDIGGGIVSAIVEENRVRIQGMTYILTRRDNNVNSYQDVDFGGTGLSTYAGMGYRFKFNNQFSFDLGGRGLYQKIAIGPEAAQAFKFQGQLYLRMLWL